MKKSSRMKSGTPELVINTGPVIALVAATGGLEWLAELYQTVWLPEAVDSELSAGGPGAPEPSRVQAAAKVVRILPQSGELPAELARQLDPGEAWVIQSALAQKVETVAIDEKVGRRVARIYGLQVTGSLGILIRARRMGVIPNLETVLTRMHDHGLWVSPELRAHALQAVDEAPLPERGSSKPSPPLSP